MFTLIPGSTIFPRDGCWPRSKARELGDRVCFANNQSFTERKTLESPGCDKAYNVARECGQCVTRRSSREIKRRTAKSTSRLRRVSDNLMIRSHDTGISQETRDIAHVLVQCWASVADDEQTLNQHMINVPCLLGSLRKWATNCIPFRPPPPLTLLFGI